MKYTLPPLVFAALALSRRVFAREKEAAKAAQGDVEEDERKLAEASPETSTPPQFSARKVFHFVIELVTATGNVSRIPA
jgi:hypothetical protein